jgi:hypothetical protein
MNDRRSSWREASKAPTSTFTLGIVAGVVIGTGLMYLLDSRQGNRRRAVARDKARHALIRGTVLTGKLFRHLRNRLEGLIATASQPLLSEGETSDRKLVERIRSTVGRTVPHPGAVDFAVHSGRVIVRGYLRPHEAGAVIQAVQRVPGVISVDNQILDSAAQHPLQ